MADGAMLVALLTCGLIVLVTLLGGLPPVLAQGQQASMRLHEWGEAFARGLFLGLGLVHFLLPAWQQLGEMTEGVMQPLVFIVAGLVVLGIGYLLQYLTIRVMTYFNIDQHYWNPSLLALLLTVHSILEGAALGIADLLGGFWLVFMAILMHKAADAFALAVSMRGSGMARKFMVKTMLVFSLMTPVGMLLASSLILWLESDPGQILTLLFDFFAGIAFVYLAVTKTRCVGHPAHHAAEGPEKTLHLPHWINVGLFLMGVINMSALAYWVE